MNLSTTILGSTAVKQLQTTGSAWVLQVGSDRLTRGELAQVGCYNYVAAKNLSNVLQEALPRNVKGLKDLFVTVPPTALALPHIGAISLAVLGAAFEACGIGGETPLENWVRHHAPRGVAAHMVTFHTLKHRELAEQANERKLRRARRRSA